MTATPASVAVSAWIIVLTVGLTVLAAVDELAALAARVVPQLTHDNGRELIAAVSGLAGSLWQIANPPDALAALYAQEPQLAHAAVEFPRKLSRLTLVS